MNLIKFSTFIVKIIHKNSDAVSYSNYTDVRCRSFKHYCPQQSAFPYKNLEFGASYTLICALLEVDGTETWYWWKAFPMCETAEGSALVDDQLESFITSKALAQV